MNRCIISKYDYIKRITLLEKFEINKLRLYIFLIYYYA